MIHLCVVNHCGEKATFYSSEPNPDHMAAPSPARFSFLPFTSPLRSPPSLVLPLDFTHSSSLPPPPPSPTVHLFNPSHLCFSASKLPPCLLPLADFLESHLAVCVCVCVCSRSMGTGLFGCQLQSALTCASNVVYCPNTSLEEHLRRPLKFKAIYHHLPPPPPPPPHRILSHHPSLPPPSLHAVTISSFSSPPPSSLIPPFPSITSIRSFLFCSN